MLGKLTRDIKEGQLLVPHRATPEGDFHSFDLTQHHNYDIKKFNKRKKRDVSDPEALHYGVTINNKLHHLELWPNFDFIHPLAVVEKYEPNLLVPERDVRSIANRKLCNYVGRVRGVNNSRVTLSTCDGLVRVAIHCNSS